MHTNQIWIRSREINRFYFIYLTPPLRSIILAFSLAKRGNHSKPLVWKGLFSSERAGKVPVTWRLTITFSYKFSYRCLKHAPSDANSNGTKDHSSVLVFHRIVCPAPNSAGRSVLPRTAPWSRDRGLSWVYVWNQSKTCEWYKWISKRAQTATVRTGQLGAAAGTPRPRRAGTAALRHVCMFARSHAPFYRWAFQ